ncbi:hypothetical protein G6F35_015763 [Rhizopus arrhizus]|nr:hypothetical protein G6F35_015763 [Rhizopus arrhizus]
MQKGDVSYWAAEVPPEARLLIDAFWPGPLTLILKRAPHIVDTVSGGQDSIGIRCPSHPVAQALLAAFAVKVPMWPVHTWLPDVHVEAPTGGSIVLAAIMLKLGAYGFLRFSLPITPDASHSLAGLMITLSVVAVIYIGLVAIIQEDMKKLVAYSSVAHMGFAPSCR